MDRQDSYASKGGLVSSYSLSVNHHLARAVPLIFSAAAAIAQPYTPNTSIANNTSNNQNVPIEERLSWPSRPIKWIVPFSAGGQTDLLTRLVTQNLQTSLGRPIVVENRPGAGTIVATTYAAAAKPDGYTLLTVTSAYVINGVLNTPAPYDLKKSLSPVSLVGVYPYILATNANIPITDVNSLIGHIKKNQGKLTYASPGIGTGAHLATELFKQQSGTFILHIPYNGTSQAMQGLMSGDIDLLMDVPGSTMPYARAGKIRPLAVLSKKRSLGALEVPTITEAGGPPIEASSWIAFLAPRGTPEHIVNRISSETAKIISRKDISDTFIQQGIDPKGSTPGEFAAFIEEESSKWTHVIKQSGVKPSN